MKHYNTIRWCRCRPLVNAYEVKADVVNVQYGGNFLSAADKVGQLSGQLLGAL